MMNRQILHFTCVILSFVGLSYFLFQNALADPTLFFQVTLTDLRVDRNGFSSSYRVTNLGPSVAYLAHSFYANGAPETPVTTWAGEAAPNGVEEIALDQLAQLPDGFQGFVIISSNEAITATLNLTDSATATPTQSPTALTATPTAPTTTVTPTPTTDPNDPTPTSTPLWHESGTPVPMVRLENLQRNPDAPSSRFQIVNQTANDTFLLLRFFFPEDQTLVAELGINLTGHETLLYDLASVDNLPTDFRGYVIIDANHPVTAAVVPVAAFISTKREGNPPFNVQFVNRSIGEYTTSTWDFGDGQTSTEANPTHTYTITGTYSVKLTVSGPNGTDTLSKPDLIKVHSFPPIHPDGWDLTFGDYGWLPVDLCSWNASHPLVVHQPDGKILLALACWNYEGLQQLFVLRYHADGAVDLTFGEQGRIQLPDGPLSALHLLPDGNFLVVSGLVLYQFAGNGTPDADFGVNGVARGFAESVVGTYTQSVRLPDGKIVAAGTMATQPLLARYNPNGTLDTTFAGAGYWLTSVSDYNAAQEDSNRWSTVAVQADGKILVGRLEYRLVDAFNQTYESKMQLQRFTVAGTPDPTFGINSLATYDGYIPKIALQSTGRIIVSGGSNGLGRLLPQGTVDSTFNTADMSNYGFIVDSADRILLINTATPQLSVLRLLADGALDETFAENGALRQPDGTSGIFLISEFDGTILLGVGLTRSGFAGLTFVRYIDDHPAPPPPSQSLTLLYAVLDNNLGDSWTRLVNNVEAGTRSGTHVRLLIDGPTDNDVYLYDIMQDNNPFCPSPTNPTCDGRYAEGINFWRVPNENSAHPESLYQFLIDGYVAYPTADKLTLSLIGHGSGWSANVLPGQPSVWRDQSETIGGMLWDDHPAAGQPESRSLSTKALGQALEWANAQSGKLIDLLYLDGCSMGMAEVAYEVRVGAKYLLASPNIDWASFNYDELLPAAATQSGEALGARWLQLEATRFRANPGHPFTLTLFDLSKMGDVATAATTFADALRGALPNQRAAIRTAFAAAGRFDSDYNGILEQADAYSDLADFATQAQSSLSAENSVVQAGQAMSTTLGLAVLAKDAEGGAPWVYVGEEWLWANYGGLGIYLPLGQDETRRQLFYTQANLAWAADTTWDEFLAEFWAGAPTAAAQPTAEMPVCHATINGCRGLANPLPVQTPPVYNIFMPILAKN